uniref:Uncharacterized protein n=1 Tax=Avena sativa TaxID=4498 RepID=A0ACD6A5Y0_AVESA
MNKKEVGPPCFSKIDKKLKAMRPTIPQELHIGILENLPPHPETLARVSVVCRAWRRIVNDPGFLPRCRTRHGAPLTIGFFHNSDALPRPFVPVDDTTGFDFKWPSDKKWTFMDCRHGRVLLRDMNWFLVWHPLTGHRYRIEAESSRWGEYNESSINAALLCVVGDDDDGHNVCCQQPTSPFRVALVHSDFHGRVYAGVYSSLTRQWTSEPTSVNIPSVRAIRAEPCVVIFNTMYQPLYDYRVLAYDMDKCTLTVFNRPRGGNVRLMKIDGSARLGLAAVHGLTMRLWARGAYGGWVLRTTVDLGEVVAGLSKAPLPRTDPRFMVMPPVKIIGVAEEGDTLFLWTMVGIFKLCPKTMEVKKVCETAEGMEIVYPYTAFPVSPIGNIVHLNAA